MAFEATNPAGECSSCGYSPVPVTEHKPGQAEAAQSLCEVCHMTMVGVWTHYRPGDLDAKLGKIIAWGINHLKEHGAK